MTKERRLGRGLEALLGGSLDRTAPRPAEPTANATTPFAAPMAAPTAAPTAPQNSGTPRIKVFDIDKSPFQPRRDFDQAEIDALAESLR